MNAKVKRWWVQALRSGRFQQGQGQLCKETLRGRFHCCLGVLEEVAKSKGIIEKYTGYDGALDEKVRQWAGLNDRDPRLGPRSDSPRAAKLNDEGFSFEYIADRIEKYL